MASVKFGKFKANRAGYSAVKNSSAVQGMLRGKAERVRSQAVSMAVASSTKKRLATDQRISLAIMA